MKITRKPGPFGILIGLIAFSFPFSAGLHAQTADIAPAVVIEAAAPVETAPAESPKPTTEIAAVQTPNEPDASAAASPDAAAAETAAVATVMPAPDIAAAPTSPEPQTVQAAAVAGAEPTETAADDGQKSDHAAAPAIEPVETVEAVETAAAESPKDLIVAAGPAPTPEEAPLSTGSVSSKSTTPAAHAPAAEETQAAESED